MNLVATADDDDDDVRVDDDADEYVDAYDLASAVSLFVGFWN